MLSKESLKAVASALGLTVSALTKGIESEEETTLDIKVVKGFTQEELDEHQATLDKEYAKGKTVGVEQFIRDAKDEFGLKFNGKKPEDFLSNLKTKIAELEDGDSGDDGVWKEKYNKLKENFDSEIGTKDEQIAALNGEKKSLEAFSKISELVPAELNGIKRSDAITLLRSGYEFSTDDDGNEVVKKGGKVIENKRGENLSYKDVITDFLTEREYYKNDGGRDDDDEGGTGGGKKIDIKRAKNMSEVRKYLDDNSIPFGSEKGMSIIQEAAQNEGFSVQE